jgi:hypothetical protein
LSPCQAKLAFPRPGDDRCQRLAQQSCSHCRARLCDVHVEFCAICLVFFCEGCLDLHNQEGQHTEGNFGELVARVVEEVAG